MRYGNRCSWINSKYTILKLPTQRPHQNPVEFTGAEPLKALPRRVLSDAATFQEVIMRLQEYFDTAKGLGVLSTADSNGQVDAAIYSRPHFMNDGTMAFIMRDRLSHHNLQSNPHASYLFKEEGTGYRGKRLFITKIREEENTELLESLRRKKAVYGNGADRFLVFFKLDKELPLIGDKKE